MLTIVLIKTGLNTGTGLNKDDLNGNGLGDNSSNNFDNSSTEPTVQPPTSSASPSDDDTTYDIDIRFGNDKTTTQKPWNTIEQWLY